MNPRKVLIVAGEPSGDLHASNLVGDLKNMDSGLEFFGMGGPLMRASGVQISFDISKLALVGLVEVWRNIFTVARAYKGILKEVDSKRPDFAILVDYPGFNLRLAKELHKRRIPVVYYISPQVWAWGRNRINIIKRCVKKIFVFFKFEEELYKTYGIDAEFIGHPLLETVKATSARDEVLKRYGLSDNNVKIAILPGSRAIEVRSLLPVMINASKIIRKAFNKVQFVIAKHKDLPVELYEKSAAGAGLDMRIADGDVYNILSVSDLAIVASGTATVETAVIGTPFLVAYKGNLLTYLVYLFVRRVPFLGMVNIIAGKEVVPEFVQFNLSPEKLAVKAVDLITNEPKKNAMRRRFDSIRASLGSPGASMRGARSILSLFR